jgi:hypothetical protein
MAKTPKFIVETETGVVLLTGLWSAIVAQRGSVAELVLLTLFEKVRYANS